MLSASVLRIIVLSYTQTQTHSPTYPPTHAHTHARAHARTEARRHRRTEAQIHRDTRTHTNCSDEYAMSAAISNQRIPFFINFLVFCTHCSMDWRTCRNFAPGLAVLLRSLRSRGRTSRVNAKRVQTGANKAASCSRWLHSHV